MVEILPGKAVCCLPGFIPGCLREPAGASAQSHPKRHNHFNPHRHRHRHEHADSHAYGHANIDGDPQQDAAFALSNP